MLCLSVLLLFLILPLLILPLTWVSPCPHASLSFLCLSMLILPLGTFVPQTRFYCGLTINTAVFVWVLDLRFGVLDLASPGLRIHSSQCWGEHGLLNPGLPYAKQTLINPLSCLPSLLFFLNDGKICTINFILLDIWSVSGTNYSHFIVLLSPLSPQNFSHFPLLPKTTPLHSTAYEFDSLRKSREVESSNVCVLVTVLLHE